MYPKMHIIMEFGEKTKHRYPPYKDLWRRSLLLRREWKRRPYAQNRGTYLSTGHRAFRGGKILEPKGTFVKKLKSVAKDLREDTKVLAARTVSEETACLQQANSRLETELRLQNKRIAELEKRVETLLRRSPPPPSPALVHTEATPVPQDIKELETRLMGHMVARLNARFEGLEPRLNPKPRMRPSLVHEMRAERNTPAASPAGRRSAAMNSRTLPPAPPDTEMAWSTVVKRGQRRRLERSIPTTNTTTPGQLPPRPPTRRKASYQPKLHAPATAAVVITFQPGVQEKDHTLVAVIANARSKINLAELGIEGVQIRRALTGAAKILITGENKEKSAMNLVNALKEVVLSHRAGISAR
ncbi:hypothetical protein ACJJTC_007191 [Scirpophaga incertulas]